MSFLNTIRGLGRSNKNKTSKKDLDAPNSLYLHANSSGSTIRRSQSPTKSPTRQSRNVVNKTSPTKPRNFNGQFDPIASNMVSLQGSLTGLPNQSASNLSASASGATGNSGSTVINGTISTASNPQVPKKLPLFLCEPFVKTALVKGSFKTIVQLPKYVDYGEWVALNIFELFNNLNQFYGIIAEHVTPEEYPTMNAGPNTNYLWVDGNGQLINLPAGSYIDYVLTWISKKINDQSVFPTKNGGAFPPNFLKDCKNIARQMFRIFAHIYWNHFEKIVHLSLEAHWNSFFAHFISFEKEFGLIEKSELEPLLLLIENLEQQGKIV